MSNLGICYLLGIFILVYVPTFLVVLAIALTIHGHYAQGDSWKTSFFITLAAYILAVKDLIFWCYRRRALWRWTTTSLMVKFHLIRDEMHPRLDWDCKITDFLTGSEVRQYRKDLCRWRLILHERTL